MLLGALSLTVLVVGVQAVVLARYFLHKNIRVRRDKISVLSENDDFFAVFSKKVLEINRNNRKFSMTK